MLKQTKPKNMNIAVIFCPGKPTQDWEEKTINHSSSSSSTSTTQSTTPPKFINPGKGGYIGAHKRLAGAHHYVTSTPSITTVIYVGGSQSKVAAMNAFFQSRGSMEGKEVVLLESNPDTNGNLHALQQWIDTQREQGMDFSDIEISLVSSDYHLARISVMARDIMDKELKFVAVRTDEWCPEEDVGLDDDEFSYEERIRNEMKGIVQWSLYGDYRNQNGKQGGEEWKCVVH
eukprot:TRINITY_DN69_c0_g1_i2.p2 TRINITY_DN69_c0_g1~~TRINITY_DN69_c0_g1_i2.p2  ORF type:complete len:231 (-),score=47.64 TRINITY_DN69_c0_g1_i2:173-865(-)